MEFNFTNKVAVVTGASTGIGAEVAKGFGKSGAKVVVHYNRSSEKAEAVVQAIQDAGGEAVAIQADLSSKAGVDQLFAGVIDEYAKVDILFNNAGALIERCQISDLPEELWDKVYDLNVKSVFLCSQKAIPLMKDNGSGVIINTASVAARNGGGGGSVHYASAKGAVLTFTKGLAKELATLNIRVNGINPGVISTPFHDQFTPDEVRKNFVNGIPMGREGTPQECVGTVLFLASEAASYITGEVIEVNGGQLTD